jgi:hypothetical protein
MNWLMALRDIIVVLGPLISDIARAIQDHQVKSLVKDLKNASSSEDKHAVATRIADVLYKRTS